MARRILKNRETKRKRKLKKTTGLKKTKKLGKARRKIRKQLQRLDYAGPTANTFAFILHPMSIEDVAKKYKIARKVSPKLVGGVLKRRRPFIISEITGIESKTGAKAQGWFIICPLLPGQILELDEEYVIEKIVRACRVAEKEGAKIVGLGAFTALVGDGGRRIAQQTGIAVTSGNTYTATTAIQGVEKAAEAMDINLSQACLAVVGATGSIGGVCAQVLAPKVGQVRLVGRNEKRLAEVAQRVKRLTTAEVITSRDISRSIQQADVIITVTGAIDCVINPEDIKPGAVVCDVARPRDVSRLVSEIRDDVLVIDGGVVRVPGPVKFNFNFGLPPRMAEGCMSETIILALEGRYESYTLGKDISVKKVEEIRKLADKHGFEVAGLRRFEKQLSAAQIEQIKKNAKKAKTKRRFFEDGM